MFLITAVPGAWAADGLFDTPQKAFTWEAKTPGMIHLKLLMSDQGGGRYLKEAIFYVKDASGNKTQFLYANETNSNTSGQVVGQYKYLIDSNDGSCMFMTNGTDGAPKWIINTWQTQHSSLRDGTGPGYMEIDWYWPTKFAGKKCTWGVEGRLYGGSTYNKEFGTIEFDEITFETFDPVIGTKDEELGTVTVPFMSEKPINWVEGKYADADGVEHTYRETLPAKTYNGFLRLPASEAHKNLVVTANVTTATWSDAHSGDPTSSTGNVTVTVGDFALIHAPRFFKTTVLDDGNASVQLSWKLDNTDQEEVLDADVFEIQRSLTGKAEDFETIGEEVFDLKQTSYTYKDSLLLSALSQDQVDSVLSIPNVRYRVRRSATSMWGWDRNPTAVFESPRFPSLHLLKAGNLSASWENKDEYKVKLSWTYEASNRNIAYVWDDRATMTLRTVLRNRNKEVVDTLNRVLTREEIFAKQLSLELTRSCVKYEFALVVDAGSSPIGAATGGVFVIADYDNWKSVVERVNNGDTKINIMMKDRPILETDSELLGTEAHPFEGQIDGNGKVFYCRFTTNKQAGAPISYAANGAVIRNVQGWSKITTSAKCAGSLLGIIKSGTVFIENSTGSTDINSNVNGDGTHGGIVGLVNDGTSLIIRNCNYDGSLLGTSTHSCGGIIGWRGNSGYARLENVLFEPHEITLQTYRSATFARNATNPLNLVLTNCIYTKTFGDIQGIDGIGQYITDLRKKMDWIGEVNACPNYSIEYKKASSHAESKFTNASGTDDFLFEATGKILPTLQWTPLQLSVLLQWETDDNPVDYFEVQRRTVGGSKEWQTIESGITAKEYEDKTTSPVYDYEYKVLAANNCEGLSFTETEVVTAHCVQTGTVEGYVRFADGTGIPDVLVSVSPSQTHPKDITTVSVRTDDSGYYKVEDLRYYTEQSGPYDISVNIAKDNLSPDCADGLGVTFDTKSNIYSNVNFTVTNGYKFSGYVMYYGTSIPVPGVEFTANEHAVQAGGKPITTGPDGKFSFFVLGGETTIQAHKDGHEFYNDGKYTHNFTTNKDKIYFYDKTRVKLIGRVVGGNDQGELPLGNSLSRNNLGQSITINMALEGDNSSWLVFDNLDSSLKERDTVFVHTAHDKKQTYQTSMHTTRHRIEIKPDKYTGEYCVELPPVKWKVQQIFAQGYPTLFQEGKTGDVIDLTDSLTLHRDVFTGQWLSYGGNDVTEVTVEYNAQYSRIYHSPVQIDYKQVGYDKFDYFGDKQYVAKNLGGDKSVVPLAYPDSITGEAVYTFGHPVFSIEKKYLFQLSANEKYYWNNNPKSDTIDVVQMKGGEVVVQNEMVSGNHRETVTLDENGQGTVFIQAAQTPYLLTGEGALRTITMTLELDGVHYEAKPLKAYVLNLYSKQGAKDILNYSVPQLVDILRDPPGGASSAKISRGSTLKYSYQMDMSWKLGLTLNFAVGTKLNNFTGVVAAPMGAGAVGGFNNIAGNDFSTSLDLVWSGSGQRAFSYTMTTTEDISTSTNNKMVGANADLYIGMEQNIIVKPATAIRAIPDSIFRQMGGELKAGRMVEIANGRDINDSIFHLVREEVVTFGPQFKSTFVHSQEYIIKQLIPSLMEQCRALMFTGTREEAQKQADYTGKPVYLSIAKPDSEQFGALYEFIKPVDGDPSQVDEVDLYHKNMLAWVDMIAANEKEKLEATELVQNFDVDGGGGISYGEDFASDYTVTNSFVSPISSSTVGYFDTTAGDIALNVVGVVGPAVAKFLGCISSKLKAGGTTGATGSGRDESGISHVEVECVGTTFKFGLIPAVSYNVVPKHSESKKFNRKESFTISMDRKSHIDFDVYRVNTIPDYVKSTGVSDVFTNYNFDDLVAYDNDYLKRELDLKDIRYARSFVYRTRGGATCRPWEGERRTVFYEPGTLLDERTKKIENPKIWLDKQSVSGVPFGEAARFTVNMTNESEHPEAAYGFFNLVLDEASNTKGAKLMIDGIPLSGNARTLAVEPSKVTTKTLEVYASEDFDYENLGLTLMSINDLDCFDKVNLSVHYLRTAGPITISTPGDKWIMNTDAQRDSRGYFMPVVISGFDKNQKNFDHVEFQYKETNRGDDYWVNLCSFYANDTLMALASGTKQKIPENGYITTSFYGEGVEMEKAYDLRAVLYCRNGNDYLTSSSKVLSGIKDTRRPQLFNTPEPKDGILGPGDNVTFNFSEAIEHNSLSAITNFEVVGET
ncbi:MAG: carboxypeptidase regulatory-like domain-containing protein, partial [Prevotella sp.]|nr:carboxypeptidase regulatory-like domain-containing protein [Prevotella sp.]